MKKTIEKWVFSLIKGKPNRELFSSNFIMEDGMTLDEYIAYEKYQFDSLSKIYDLSDLFSIQILKEIDLKDKIIMFFYIINDLQKIVCKMSLTLEKETKLLTSNNSNVQVVPKFTIEDDNVTQIGIAIKPKYPLKKVFCNQYDLISFSPGDNYDNDFFYTAKFECDNDVQNKLINFTFVLENESLLIERKYVFFDVFLKKLKPFEIKENELTLLNDKYPVHLSTWSNLGENKNYEYPRDIKLSLNNINKFIVTDSIDNDWIVKK
jgi:hypothetical protein